MPQPADDLADDLADRPGGPARQAQTALPPHYDPADIEPAAYERWVASGAFTPSEDPAAPPFCVVIPPPNVTGSLHIGHAFEHTLIDALTRRRRMQGYATLWLPGMDHAGIATQNAVERDLAQEGLSRHDLGRERFVERVWQWKAEYGGRILHQMRRLGAGVDWTRERFTMDEGLSAAVLTMFARLYRDGLIYRAERIINWCPRCLTALSDIEVVHSDDEGELVSIRYGPVTVATTRVETMLGDTAVAVHPDDDRYRDLVGTEVEVPLTGRRVPIVADEHVDPGFGTGAVKVTPAHDPNDFEIARRHDLPALTIMDERGVITAAGPFQGLDRLEARPAVTAALREIGAVVAERRPYVHAVGHCSRCRTVIEPRLSLQWFIKVAPLAKAAGDAVRDGRVSIHPEEQRARWFGWVDDMHDWCISRQLWWGHRIPVWYSPTGEAVCVGPGEQPPPGWSQDPDVLDTWFSSGLWPFSTLGWPERTPDLARFYPTSVLVTGYDILFFWVARMMMFGLYAMDDQPPFRAVVLHGMVRDERGRKMSKSAGNVVDPLEWVDRFGADAVRFTLARGANPGADVPVSEEWAAASRNFATKLWNGVRFAVLNGAAPATLPPRAEWATADRWILSRLAATIEEVDRLFDAYEFGKVADALFHFAWDEVFDWYVELAKAPLAAGGRAADVTRAVLGHVLDALLRLLHPLMPFVTDTLWRTLTGGESLVLAAWPVPAADADAEAEQAVEALQGLVTEVRRFRADQGVKATRRLRAVLAAPAEDALPAWLAEHLTAFGALTRLQPLATGDLPAAWPRLTAAGVTVAVEMAGAVDVAAERSRLSRALQAAEAELAQTEAKLANADFVGKAPPPVVEKMRARRAAAVAEVRRLHDLLAALPAG